MVNDDPAFAVLRMDSDDPISVSAWRDTPPQTTSESDREAASPRFDAELTDRRPASRVSPPTERNPVRVVSSPIWSVAATDTLAPTSRSDPSCEMDFTVREESRVVPSATDNAAPTKQSSFTDNHAPSRANDCTEIELVSAQSDITEIDELKMIASFKDTALPRRRKDLTLTDDAQVIQSVTERDPPMFVQP